MLGFLRRKPASDVAPVATPVALDLSLVVPLVKAIVAGEAGDSFAELKPDDAPISTPLVAELIVMYALDYPDRFEFISGRHLRESNLSTAQLHELALKNLLLRTPSIEMLGDSPCHMITAGGNMEATLLLHDALWEQIAAHLPGDPMAVVPARDLLFVSGTGWDGALEFLSSVANKELEDARYALSKCVLVRRDGKWHTYAPAS
ncbi:DUF1444 family protein [Ideonella sp.]|uniref:DUF1444 family protein n=1 Tax=Ideonella sp. TaxID=1929293 RepID=UPI003BB64014